MPANSPELEAIVRKAYVKALVTQIYNTSPLMAVMANNLTWPSQLSQHALAQAQQQMNQHNIQIQQMQAMQGMLVGQATQTQIKVTYRNTEDPPISIPEGQRAKLRALVKRIMPKQVEEMEAQRERERLQKHTEKELHDQWRQWQEQMQQRLQVIQTTWTGYAGTIAVPSIGTWIQPAQSITQVVGTYPVSGTGTAVCTTPGVWFTANSSWP